MFDLSLLNPFVINRIMIVLDVPNYILLKNCNALMLFSKVMIINKKQPNSAKDTTSRSKENYLFGQEVDRDSPLKIKT